MLSGSLKSGKSFVNVGRNLKRQERVRRVPRSGPSGLRESARPLWKQARKEEQAIQQMRLLEDTLTAVFTRTDSIAEAIENLVRNANYSIDAALYRFNNQRLAQALSDAHKDGVRIRLVTDRSKYEESPETRNLLSKVPFSFRSSYGLDGDGSKMHHKFVLFDNSLLLTGSYNWTSASEEKNFENLLILQAPKLIETYQKEFEAIWEASR
jgi:phosphatidylserine/phosphatidylglycerophosphate/cardiolipin synthase-like enzyme